MTNTLGLFRRCALPVALALSLVAPLPLRAQSAGPIDPRIYSALSWRNLGPFRAGRVAAVSGAIGQPGVFYIGLPAAGVWKTTSAGQTWYPIFDAVKDVSSIGSVEVAPSDPNVVYVGTGDIITGGSINEGNGVYKSTDAGRTWRHLGLDATKQIPSMSVDPHDPNIVLLAAQGNVHAKSHDRGVYRSTDGGATWTQTLFVDDSTGAQKVARAFDTPMTVFATTVAHYTSPTPPAGGFGGGGGRGGPQTGPTSTKLFKSVDGGVTWKEITGGGLPARLTGKLWVAVANNTNAQRVFVIGDAGLFRSDDGGATWHQMAADDQRIRNGQGGYNCGVYVDPQNPDIVYTLNTASYKSTDGGKTFTGFKGAPGGDDPQQMWIDPTNGQRILFGYDQGAIVSLDGGGTWSSWYNQSTDQIYHLSVDNSVPYWVYGTQQDAGAIRTRIRGNLGAITPLDWNPVSGWEWGTIVPDPLDPNTVYASGSGILKISYPSEQWINVSPSQDASRQLRTTSDQPLVFAPWNKHMLIAAFQSVWTTIDGGAHWTSISPDLAVRPDAPRPANGGPPTRRRDSVDARVDRRHGHDLGRHEQWADQGHARRRQDMVRREHPRNSQRAARRSALRRTVALRRRRSVRRARPIPTRRLHAVRFPHARLRQILDAYRRRPRDEPTERELRARRAERPAATRTAVRRHGERHVRVVRRRRSLAVAAARPADHVVPRHRAQGQ